MQGRAADDDAILVGIEPVTRFDLHTLNANGQARLPLPRTVTVVSPPESKTQGLEKG